MHVLDYHYHRLPRRQSLDLGQQRLERPLFLLLRAQIERQIAVPGWDRQQRREQGERVAAIVDRLAEHRLQFVHPLLDGVLPPKSGRSFELRDGWIERSLLVMRRAEIAQTGMRLTAQPL